jgi:hypothetical protein
MKLWIFALTLVAALVAGAHTSFAQVDGTGGAAFVIPSRKRLLTLDRRAGGI